MNPKGMLFRIDFAIYQQQFDYDGSMAKKPARTAVFSVAKMTLISAKE